jgi:hypothetical protein
VFELNDFELLAYCRKILGCIEEILGWTRKMAKEVLDWFEAVDQGCTLIQLHGEVDSGCILEENPGCTLILL